MDSSSIIAWLNVFEICEKTSSGEQNCANYNILSYSVWLFDHYSGQATVELLEAGDRQADLTRILERAYISAEPRGIHLLDRARGDRGDEKCGRDGRSYGRGTVRTIMRYPNNSRHPRPRHLPSRWS